MFKKSIYYNSAKDMPFYNFIQIVETGDLKYVMLSGKGKADIKLKRWNSIFSEYTKLTSNDNQNHILSLVKYVAFMSVKIDLILFCLRSIEKAYNKELSDLVNILGVKVKIDIVDTHKSIKIASSEIKRMKTSVDEKQKEIDDMSKNSSTNSGDFESLLLDISKHQGYAIKSKEISVFEFCILLNRYSNFVKKSNKKNGQ